ncbi:MAG: nucleotidyl transferase AbiEii/AbiGii toxin family protein [Candidatus Woesearchaeota archaeon]|nr:nucleotidyl transferase AbiEii/AbiGii toxin family protein [Candidatus Woesearchaeota archaeon]
MISIEELSSIKEKRKTNLYYEEKEYLQYIFLNAISNYPENFVFKGGTCLRICFGLERASEDLDFNTNLSINGVKDIIYKCLKDFELLNIGYEIYSEKEFEGNFRIEARFKGPLFIGRQASTNTLKIDFNKGKAKHKAVKVIQKLFSDVPLFTIAAMDEKELLAEKIRTLVNRADARDLYDVWVLLNKNIEADKKLIYEKLKEENAKLSNLKFPSKEEYERDLKNLVSKFPSYEQARKEVSESLAKLKR